MDYMDAWDGKKLVDSSLEKVCVSIFKISYFLQLLCLFFVSKCACSFFGLLTYYFYVFSQGSVLEYRKHAAALLLLSQHNVVKLDDFVKNYESKET
jgi:hypothetical protein